MDFYIGQKFTGNYPPESAIWCNENGAVIVQAEGGFEIHASPVPTLTEVQAAKRLEINGRFEAALIASLTIPSVNTPPSAYAVYTALEEWKTEYPEDFADLLAIHESRRDALLAAVDAATSIEAVHAITVSYAV